MFPAIGQVERWADPFVDALLAEEPAVPIAATWGGGAIDRAP